MIYENILLPFRSTKGTIKLSIYEHSPYKWHPTRDFYDIFIDTWPPEYYNPIIAQSFEALRSLSNAHPLIRQELGQLFWKDASIQAPYNFGQQRLPYFFASRPAITHLTCLDLGRWSPNWYGTYSVQRQKKTLLFRDLARLNVTFDYLKMELSTFPEFQEKFAFYPATPVELDDANIVDILSSNSRSGSDNLEIQLQPSSYDWVNAFRELSLKVKKAVQLKVHQPSKIQELVLRDNVFRGVKCPLLQWHLCPGKRPTFMSLLGHDLKLPKKIGTDLMYHFMHVGMTAKSAQFSPILSSLSYPSIFDTNERSHPVVFPNTDPEPVLDPTKTSKFEIPLTSDVVEFDVGMDAQITLGMQWTVDATGDVTGTEVFCLGGEGVGCGWKRKWGVTFEGEKYECEDGDVDMDRCNDEDGKKSGTRRDYNLSLGWEDDECDDKENEDVGLHVNKRVRRM